MLQLKFEEHILFHYKKTLIALSAALLMSCSTVEFIFTYNSPSDMKPEEAAEMLSRSEPVSSVFEGSGVDVVQANYDETIDFSDKLNSYNFSTGKSFFKTYKLPLAASNMRFVVTSYIGKTMAVPDIALFNSDRKLIKVIRYSAFTYSAPDASGMRSMKFSLAINNFSAGDKAVNYAVLFITNESRNSSTTIPNPAKEFQEAAHNDTSGFHDIVIPHSAAGRINVSFDFGTEGANLWEQLKGPLLGGGSEYRPDNDDGQVASDQDVKNREANSVIKNAAVKSSRRGVSASDIADGKVSSQSLPDASAARTGGSMLPETEEMYNSMIEDAVKQGNYNKAMQLAEEADKAGSPSAKNKFLQLINSRKK